MQSEKIQGYKPGETGNRLLDQKNEEWRNQDKLDRTLFEFLQAEADGDAIIKKQDLIQPYLREGSRVWDELIEKEYLIEETKYTAIQHYDVTKKHTISPADSMQQFVALVDPHGLIHLTSGIQPVKTIQLPAQFIKDALNRIEMSFLTAPVLGPENQLNLSLPKEQDYQWVWQEKNQWSSDKDETVITTEVDETEISPFRTVANFPERVVLREGHLVLRHKAENKNQSSVDD